MPRVLRLIPLILLCALIAAPPAPAQTTKKSTPLVIGGGGKPDDNPFEMKDSKSSSSDPAKSAPLERAVDPATYRLGPNDVLSLSIPSLDFTTLLIVSPDNTVILPRGVGGLIDVRLMTLAELRHKTDSLYRARSKMLSANVSISLLRARAIYITVKGDVTNPGRFVLSAADRVTIAIDLANKIPEDVPELMRQEYARERLRASATAGYGSSELGSIASGQIPVRRVQVRHNDGTFDNADLIRYRAFGDERENPVLREGDEIIVRRPDPSGPMLTISGAVNDPQMIPYRAGDNAFLLLRLAAGLRDDADEGGAAITRSGLAGITTLPLNVIDSAALVAQALQPGDQLVVPILTQARMTPTGMVTVRGEVVRSSTYPIVPGVTKLSQVIEKAGGLTPDASLNGAYIIRAVDPKAYRLTNVELGDIKAGMSTSSLKLEDTLRYKYDQELQRNRVSADFVAIFDKHDLQKDIPLQHGDEIIIPRNPRQVFVYGRISHPGWVEFKSGADIEQYVVLAGGYTESANKGRVSIRKFGTGVWESGDKATVLPGDQVYVAGDVDTPTRTSLETASTYLSITYSSLGLINTIYDLVSKIFKKP